MTVKSFPLISMQKQFHTKNQHYVPQFYLRNFSEDGSGIRTFNLTSGKIIPHAKLKCQCSKDYFYGEDGVLESALGGMETYFSIAFKNCLAMEHRKAKISDEQFYLLSLFAAVQYMRTKKYMETSEDFGKLVYKAYADLVVKTKGLNLPPNSYEIKTDKDFPRFVLRIGVLNHPLLNDLECIILNNCTKEDFILSDNPVVFQNPFLEKFVKYNCCGMASRGLQIYFPISPRRSVCFYDPEVYKFSGKNLVDLSSPRDVEFINKLQFMNADKNIYFKYDNLECGKYIKFRNDNIGKQLSPIGKYVNPSKPDEFLFRISQSSLNINFKLSIFSIKPLMLNQAYRGEKDLRLWYRDPKIKYLVGKFKDAVDKGEYDGSDFERFRDEKINEILNSIKKRKWQEKIQIEK